jgi:nitrite reductase/ring-hydroxylating ferredoxin subunit
VRIAGRSLALFASGGGVVALDNACRHNGSPVDDGFVADGCLTCPWHGWRYDLASGDQLTLLGRHPGLRRYPTRIEGGEIWVEIP